MKIDLYSRVVRYVSKRSEHKPVGFARKKERRKLTNLIIITLCDINLDGIINTKWFTLIVVTRLKCNGAWRVGGEIKEERVSIGSEFAKKAILNRRGFLLLFLGREYLLLTQHHLPTELDAHHFILLATIAVGGDHLRLPFKKSTES